MTVGLLIVTHNLIGEELITTATSIHGDQSLAMHSISIPSSLEPAELGGYADEIRNAIVDFKSEHRVLNYSQQTLDQIAVTATEGANKGIILGL